MSVCTLSLQPRTAPVPRQRRMPGWLSFLGQIGLVAAVEVTDDLLRGAIAQHGSAIGIANAVRVVRFEAAHGFMVEPGWQRFFEQTHHVLGLAFGWAQAMLLVNGVYTVGHVGVTFAFALWIYLCRRELFPFFRNIFFASNALALVLYELYPMAPPRLTPHLHMIDTLPHLLGSDGKLGGTGAGYDEFAAMPSLHMAWALIVGAGVLLTARPLAVRALAPLYPALMLVAVVVTANHFLMDAVGAAAVVSLAAVMAVALRWWQGGRGSLHATLRDLWILRHGMPARGAQAAGVSPAEGTPSRVAA